VTKRRSGKGTDQHLLRENLREGEVDTPQWAGVEVEGALGEKGGGGKGGGRRHLFSGREEVKREKDSQ